LAAEQTLKQEGRVTTRRVRQEKGIAEDDARRQRLDDPDVQARLREVREVIDSRAPLPPGIDADSLPGFLRDWEQTLEPGS
jgi:hypothetical protein